MARRWDANQSLSSWNVAALGLEQNKDPSDADYNNLTRVSLNFQSMEGESLLLIVLKDSFEIPGY